MARVGRRKQRKRPLTAMQQVFVAEYFNCYYNAARAARIAGYSQKNSDVAASKLMAKPHIRAIIDCRLAKEEAAREREFEARLNALPATRSKLLAKVFASIQASRSPDSKGVVKPNKT